MCKFQKQPPRGVPRKSCFENMQQIYRRTPMPKCDFNKVARHGSSPVNLLHIFRKPFPRNTPGWLLLQYVSGRFFLSLERFDLTFFLQNYWITFDNICVRFKNQDVVEPTPCFIHKISYIITFSE